MLVDGGADGAHLDAVHRHHVVEVAVAGNPADQRRVGGDAGGLHAAGGKGNVCSGGEKKIKDQFLTKLTKRALTFANHDSASGVLGILAIPVDGSDADSMWLNWVEMNE